jgi:4-hydroxy-2-oxovalerate aldolase
MTARLRSDAVEVLECTLRDGSYALDFQFTREDTLELCRELDRAGFRWIEVGHGFGLGARGPKFGTAAATDAEYLAAAAEGCRRAKFGAFFIPGIGTHDHLELAADHGMGFVRIGTNVSRVEEAEAFVRHAKRLGMTVAYNAMKSYATAASELAARLRQTVDWGADWVYIVDSAGCMLPAEVEAYVRRVCEAVSVPVGFHGHNNLHLAIANCVATAHGGGRILDSTLQGIGRSGGNAQTEVLLVVLEKLGYTHGIDLMRTYEIGERAITPRMRRPHGMSSLDLTLGRAQFHSSYLPAIQQVADETGLDPRVLIMGVSKVNIESPTIELMREVAVAIQSPPLKRAG